MTDATVPLDSIAKAPQERPPQESLSKNQDPLTGRNIVLDQHLGKVGRLIGGGPEKAGNVAFLVIAAAVLLLVSSGLFMAYSQSETLVGVFDKLVTISVSLITGASGYLFGNGQSNGSKV